MSTPVYRYIPSEKDDGTADILQMVVYPETHPDYEKAVPVDTARTFNDALHFSAAANHVELMNLTSKLESENTVDDYKQKYVARDRFWDVKELLADIRANNFMLRVDNHTTFVSNFDNQRRVTDVMMMHYKTPCIELATTIDGVHTITLIAGDDITYATMRRMNCILRYFGWELRRYDKEGESTIRLRELANKSFAIDYEDGMWIDINDRGVYSPSLDLVIEIGFKS